MGTLDWRLSIHSERAESKTGVEIAPNNPGKNGKLERRVGSGVDDEDCALVERQVQAFSVVLKEKDVDDGRR